MKSDAEILQDAAARFQEHNDAARYWRDNELIDSYQVESGLGQWLKEDYDKQIKDGSPVITINKSSAVIDAIAGFEIQNRTKAKFIPRTSTPKAEGYVDAAVNAVAYIEEDSGAAMEDSQAFKDMLRCGIGSTNTSIEYDDNPDGEGCVRRFFPGFLLWDPAARRKNMKDANWLAEAQVKPVKAVAQEHDITEDEARAAFYDDQTFLNYFDILENRLDLTVEYEYQWREREPIWRLKNPFGPYADNPLVMNYLAEAVKAFGIKPEDSVLTLNRKDWTSLKEGMDALGIQFEKPLKQKKFKYYRAIIVGGKVVDKAENYSQKGFSIKVMTGKYDELNQCFYGVMRALKPAQRLLNQAVSDYQGFLNTIPKGGVELELDAVPDIKAFKDTWGKARTVTVYKPGGLAKSRPKVAPPMPAGLPDMITFADQSIMRIPGLNESFMGIMTSKDMTGLLNGQQIRQALTTLADYFDAKKFYTIERSKLNMDCVRVLAENADGRAIRNVLGEGKEPYIALLKDEMAAEYDVIVEEAPQTPGERQETFQKLMELATALLSKPQNPVDITPLAVEFAPLGKEKLDKVKQAMIPPPPPPPDPTPTMVLQSEAALNMAEAELKRADAKKKEAETLQKIQEIQAGPKTEPVDAGDPAETALRLEELALEKQKLELEEKKLTLEATKLVLEEKQMASNERVNMAKLTQAERQAVRKEAAGNGLPPSDAEKEEREERALREIDDMERAEETNRQHATLQQQITQVAQIMDALKSQDNAEISKLKSQVSDALDGFGKTQGQIQVSLAALAKSMRENEQKRPAKPEPVTLDIKRNKKGNIIGAKRSDGLVIRLNEETMQ